MVETVLDNFQQAVLANQTITTTGSSAVLMDFGHKECTLLVNLTASPTGTTPTITFSIAEIDPGNEVTVLPGTTVTGASLNAIGTQILTLPVTYAGSIKVTWTVTGTTPSFTGVYATLVNKGPSPAIYDQSGNGPVAVKAASTAVVAADPSLAVGLSPNSPLPAGINAIGTVAQGTANTLANAWTVQITDAVHGPAAVKAASTAAVATDPALVVAISPNNPLTISAGDATTTGALAALNAVVTVTHPGLQSVGFQLAVGTLIGTIVPEVSFDGGTTWDTTQFAAYNSVPSPSITFSAANTATSAIILGVGGAGMTRVRVSAYTSGTASITIRASDILNGFTRTNVGSDLTIIHNAATVTTGGTVYVNGVGRKEVCFGVYLGGTVTGGTPSLSYTLQEVDAVTNSFDMTLPGNSVINGPFTATGHNNYVEMISFTGAIRVTWTCSGTFAGVDAWLVVKEATLLNGLTFPGVPTPLSVVNIDSNNNTVVVGPSAGGAAPSGNPVLVAGVDGVNVQTVLTDTTGRLNVVGAAAAGAAVTGNPVLVAGSDGTDARTLGVVVDRAAMTAGSQTAQPMVGQSFGVGRIIAVNRLGNVTPGNQTLLAADVVEGTTINSWLWTQSATTMTIAQTTGVLTLNNNATTTTNTDAIITSIKQFPILNNAGTMCSFRALITQTTNAVNEIGFGAPAGTTAIVNNGAFFRVTASGQVKVVTSFNGTETVSSVLATLVVTRYYIFEIAISDDGVRFIMEDSGGVPLIDTTQALPLTTAGVTAVSHIPAFARVYTSGTAGAAPKILISSFQAFQYGIDTSQPYSEQLCSSGRNSNISPTAFTQTLQCAAAANAASLTPVAAGTSAYTTLGGEFNLTQTATSVNLLGVFAFTVPSPYSLVITEIIMAPPTVTTAITTSTAIEFVLQIASSAVPSSATGPRYPLGSFGAIATAAIGSALTGMPINWSLKSPLIVPPGQVVLIMNKVIVGAAVGAYYGNLLINGYFI